MAFVISAQFLSCYKRLNEVDEAIKELPGGGGKWQGKHQVHVEARGNLYRFVLDNKEICSFRDSTFTSGKVGLWVQQGEYIPNPEPWIDNFKITKEQSQ